MKPMVNNFLVRRIFAHAPCVSRRKHICFFFDLDVRFGQFPIFVWASCCFNLYISHFEKYLIKCIRQHHRLFNYKIIRMSLIRRGSSTLKRSPYRSCQLRCYIYIIILYFTYPHEAKWRRLLQSKYCCQ